MTPALPERNGGHWREPLADGLEQASFDDDDLVRIEPLLTPLYLKLPALPLQPVLGKIDVEVGAAALVEDLAPAIHGRITRRATTPASFDSTLIGRHPWLWTKRKAPGVNPRGLFDVTDPTRALAVG